MTEARLPAGTEALATLPPSAELTAVGDRTVEDWLDVRSALLIAPAGPVTLSFADGRTVTVDLPAEDSLRAELVRALEPEIAPVVGRVLPGSPAERAGIQAGDSIIQAGGRPIRIWQDLLTVVSPRAGEPIEMVIVRDGGRVTLTVVPDASRVAEGPNHHHRIMIRLSAGGSANRRATSSMPLGPG